MEYNFKLLRLAILAVWLAFSTSLFAVPAKPGQTKSLTLTDGTTVVATLVGDEHGHYWAGADGKAYPSFLAQTSTKLLMPTLSSGMPPCAVRKPTSVVPTACLGALVRWGA